MSHGHSAGPGAADGVAVLATLPDATWADRWDDIVVDPGVKSRLLGHALFSLTQRAGRSRVALPVSGLALLAGAPGTGKTTLAHGLANEAAGVLARRGIAAETVFAVVDPHAFPSEFLGESQRAVARLFKRTLPDLAADGRPLVVLVDEVEALAPSRHHASFTTNPVDVHRATAAVLTGVDELSARCPNVLILVTTNEPRAVDAAFVSRADLVESFDLPGLEAAQVILASTLREFGTGLDGDADAVKRLAELCVDQHMDARQVRKSVLRAVIGNGADLALSPEGLSHQDLWDAVSAGSPG
ncbi:AAA family ATPase [Jiangella mangrovi]|uniref:SpoVK/Ycf46/Vps4 family AAA+-type ATPase n=1 Tax=Jiangella mangrovi TaxID=1524084 RepID=A0A7W9GUA1_9ACTN|nr:AAA family ATPase [Jiangella mangrovi]MBB5790200.1 SpoVK/Ycf46/Vps4 family AAA+-type ATPase [Jiangella mangrovi]